MFKRVGMALRKLKKEIPGIYWWKRKVNKCHDRQDAELSLHGIAIRSNVENFKGMKGGLEKFGQ
jgi:hypothetical protein